MVKRNIGLGIATGALVLTGATVSGGFGPAAAVAPAPDSLLRLDPTPVDSDGDGLSDYDEETIYHTNSANPDSDWDAYTDPATGVISGLDGEEVRLGLNPHTQDTDEDHLWDGQDIVLCDPLDPDTDDDGLEDGSEVVYPWQPGIGLFHVDCHNPDSDGDGLLDGYESTIRTHAGSRDTDTDGREDGEEVLRPTDGQRWNPSNPIKADTDKDGLKDGQELWFSARWLPSTRAHGRSVYLRPDKADTDRDGYKDGAEVRARTNPADKKSHPRG